jgi:membrane-bound lytic murein transglycosylase MltF
MRYLVFLITLLFSLQLLAAWPEYRDLYFKWQLSLWPDLNPPTLIASLIYQESQWKPKAELKTDREYGIGLSQITIAYTSTGAIRFDNFTEARKKYAELKDWKYEDRFDAEKHIIYAIKEIQWLYIKFNKPEYDNVTRYALSLASYNGGLGGILKEVAMCKSDPECDSTYWFCNIANKSMRSKVPVKGYSKSFWQINREYPIRIMFININKVK